MKNPRYVSQQPFYQISFKMTTLGIETETEVIKIIAVEIIHCMISSHLPQFLPQFPELRINV